MRRDDSLAPPPQQPEKPTHPARTLEAARTLFEPAQGSTYLDSATFGLPPRPTVDALSQALEGWRLGTARWREEWDVEGETCRALFGDLIHAGQREVALMPAVSVAAGVVATAVPEGGEVLLPEGEFTSLLYPFLAAAKRGRCRVREVPLDALANEVRPETRMVAASLVQSSDGRLLDVEGVVGAARGVGARVFLDVTQALGVVAVDVRAMDIDFLTCSGYKWLCCPRGTAFLWLRPEASHEPWPVVASWRGGDDPYGRYYGSPLALADDAAGFDVALTWHAWVGARHSLEVLASVPEAARQRRAVGLTHLAAERLELPTPDASILAVPVRDHKGAAQALEASRIRVAVRAGRVRVSPHFYNHEDEIERTVEALRPFR